MNLCWIGEETLAAGPHAIAERIAVDRRAWKEQAARGKSTLHRNPWLPVVPIDAPDFTY